MMLFIENVKLALTAIKSNKMRSFLTMLGIIIGISSVIAITSIGDSAKGAVEKEFEGVGAGYLYIYPDWQMAEEENGGYIEENQMFTWDEIAAVKERFPEKVDYTSPYVYETGKAKVGKTEVKINVQGVNAHYDEYYKRIQMKYGRMVNETDVAKHKNTIVIDVRAALRLYGRENVVGEKFPVEGPGMGIKDFAIVGVYEEPASLFSGMMMGEPTYSCYGPYTSVESYSSEINGYVEMFANPEYDVQETADEICRWLERVKKQKEGFYTVSTAESELSSINRILGILSIAIGAIAAISLLVGGIGIMNIMLVSVTERTREIGIRKSLGARTKDIMTQFLIEAMILSVIGGIIGLLLGLGIAGIGMLIAGVGLVINPFAVILAITFSAGVGLFFGMFPAKKAAKLDPIEALRYE